ncbi:MAG TPA: hypothetical protein VJK02_20820 [Anaerolineales bacterium]|nr:hypothetical protein [Anaerolineales bacterium]
MSRNLALGLFLATCVMLAVLLLIRAIKPLDAGAVFAIALVLFGGLSRGFRGGPPRPPK